MKAKSNAGNVRKLFVGSAAFCFPQVQKNILTQEGNAENNNKSRQVVPWQINQLRLWKIGELEASEVSARECYNEGL